MANRRKSAGYLFVFFQFWMSSYATYGGVIVNVFSALFKYTNTKLSVVAFFGCGISLYLFVYFLYPETHEKEQRGLGCRVVGCLILATYYKIFKVRIRGKRGYFDKTEGKYDRTTISRTKEILMLYASLTPTLGMCFFKMLTTNSLFFITMFNKIQSDKYTKAIGREQLGRLIKIVSMLFSYFCLWPLVTLIGLKKSHANKFLVGHLLVVLFMFYFAFAMKGLENPRYSGNSGFVRIFNTRENPIYLVPQDPGFSRHIVTVKPNESVMVAYPSSYPGDLFAMNVVFNGTETSFTMFLSVTSDKTTGYMAIDPPDIVRIRGPYLPLREGPPGTNGVWPRIYIYNAAQTLDGYILNVWHGKSRHATIKIELRGGIMTTLYLEPGTYGFSITHADVDKEDVRFEEGGVYGIMIFATTFSREIGVDTVVPPNTASSWICVAIYVLSGLALAIANPTLLAMVFNISPHGLPTMSLSFVASLEGLSMWIAYIGFNTWHYFVTGSVLFTYAYAITVFFFLSMFILIKFKDRYS